MPPGNGNKRKIGQKLNKGKVFFIAKKEKSDVLKAAANASIQIGDGDVLPPEKPDTAGAGAMALYLVLITPASNGGRVDAKDASDLSGG
jgi:hypothetical protein